ncbi:MAG TPA: acyl-CoA dehydrogenase family protein [Frankiaceae bacterium]|nr:acyl-CoA dehydrogenase family protein [Frankiaceae bacterium]
MFTLTADQELFEATTAQFLAAHYGSERIRQMRYAPAFEPEIWQRGAELGWTSLLAAEADGGGSISGNGLLDLLVVAFHFGRHAAPGPLLGTNVVALALGRWGSAAQRQGPLAGILSGVGVAAWAGPVGQAARVQVDDTGEHLVLNGAVACVDGAADAHHLVVSAEIDQSITQYLVPLVSPGISLSPLEGLDLTRRFHRVTFTNVRLPTGARLGAPGEGSAQDAELLDVMAVLQAGEIAGAMHRAFEITLQWTLDRYSFGRPLASYQEIKHRVADLRMHLEASEAAAARAARAVGERAPDASTWAAAAKAYTGRHGPEMIQDCIQLHGGIGVTFEHDLHLFLRRAVTDAQLYGTPESASRRVAQLIETPESLVAAR